MGTKKKKKNGIWKRMGVGEQIIILTIGHNLASS
jgi:hypothetical protein